MGERIDVKAHTILHSLASYVSHPHASLSGSHPMQICFHVSRKIGVGKVEKEEISLYYSLRFKI
jgi:hypothetical protein